MSIRPSRPHLERIQGCCYRCRAREISDLHPTFGITYAPSLASATGEILVRDEKGPHTPFDLESLDLEVETERLEAEKVMPSDRLGISPAPGYTIAWSRARHTVSFSFTPGQMFLIDKLREVSYIV